VIGISSVLLPETLGALFILSLAFSVLTFILTLSEVICLDIENPCSTDALP
jgi:hypothetical protein